MSNNVPSSYRPSHIACSAPKSHCTSQKTLAQHNSTCPNMPEVSTGLGSSCQCRTRHSGWVGEYPTREPSTHVYTRPSLPEEE
eukprot:2086751-Rhodomonas_salina.1